MGAYLNISRIKREESFIENESIVYDLIEVDLSKIMNYKIGETISFRNGIMTLDYLSNHPYKGDFGIYNNSDFFFYTMAVATDFGISYKYKDGKRIVALFKPEKILGIITIILDKLSSLRDANASEVEIYDLSKLKIMLEEATTEHDYILLMWS